MHAKMLQKSTRPYISRLAQQPSLCPCLVLSWPAVGLSDILFRPLTANSCPDLTSASLSCSQMALSLPRCPETAMAAVLYLIACPRVLD